MNWGLEEVEVGLTASTPRPISKDILNQISSFAGPKVMVGFGGFGYKLSKELFEKWPEHLFLIKDCPALNQPPLISYCKNVISIPSKLRLIDILPYCSRHIGKPGYSTFAETISQGVGLHVAPRKNFAESEELINGLQKHGFHRIISQYFTIFHNF